MIRLNAILRPSACAAALALLLAGCGTAGALDHLPAHVITGRPAMGHVAGRLLIWGGTLKQSQSGPRPIRGVVTFTAEGHQRVKVRVGPSGTFTASLPPGRYQMSGRSPSIILVSNGARRETPCSQPLTVAVTADRTVRATLICYVP